MNVLVKETGEAVEESGPIDSLAVNATHIAWGNDFDGTVQSHPLALADPAKGSDFRLLGRNYASNPQALALGGSDAFWNFGARFVSSRSELAQAPSTPARCTKSQMAAATSSEAMAKAVTVTVGGSVETFLFIAVPTSTVAPCPGARKWLLL